MKNKLWIYGCSYSNDANHPRTDDGWFDYIAKEFNLEYMDRSGPGYGWSKHRDVFYGDCSHWDENDMIIVESSHLVRLYSAYIQTRFCQFKYYPEYDCIVEPNDDVYMNNLLYITKDIVELREQNWQYFVDSLLFLKKYVKRWFWWTFEFYPNEFEIPKFLNDHLGDRFLKFENNIETFDMWMRSNPRYCFDLEKGDLHQTYECHKVQGELFINQIKDYEKRRTNISL